MVDGQVRTYCDPLSCSNRLLHKDKLHWFVWVCSSLLLIYSTTVFRARVTTWTQTRLTYGFLLQTLGKWEPIVTTWILASSLNVHWHCFVKNGVCCWSFGTDECLVMAYHHLGFFSLSALWGIEYFAFKSCMWIIACWSIFRTPVCFQLFVQVFPELWCIFKMME